MKKLNTHSRIYRSLSLLFLLSSLPLNAAWIDRKAEGWAWYEDKEPEKKEEVVGNPVPVVTASERLEKYQKDLHEKQSKAVLEPTQENVREYMEQQQITMDMATEFSKSWAKVLLSHPQLDFTAKENPVTAYGVQIQKQVKKQEKESLINQISKDHALLYIYNGNELECQAFAYVVNLLIQKYDFELLAISVDGTLLEGFKNNNVNNGIVEKLEVTIFPALFMVNPETKIVTPISYGMKAMDSVEDNIFMQFKEEMSK